MALSLLSKRSVHALALWALIALGADKAAGEAAVADVEVVKAL